MIEASTDGGENPLLSPLPRLPQWLADPDLLMRELMHSPITRETKLLPLGQRRLLTGEFKRIFVPTPTAIAVATRILVSLYEGIVQRNPVHAKVQRWTNATTQWIGQSVEVVPWFPTNALGMVIEGLTGIGKSHIVDRVLHLLPQVIDHEPNGEWGMHRLKQLVWLKVPMPADHSRKGLLVNILAAMDEVLGTEYRRSQAKTTEILLVNVMVHLAQHRCGLLVIEEAQEKNLGSVTFSRDFANFFLRVLNWGVPVVLLGNPKAFDLIRNYSQDVDRFSEGGWFTLMPELRTEHRGVWEKLWMPGLWAPTLLDVPEPFVPLAQFEGQHDWPSLLWMFTGGLPRQLCRLRMAVQEHALAVGATAITTQLVEYVFRNSPHFTVTGDRNIALANRDVRALKAYDDMPIALLARYWRTSQAHIGGATSAVREREAPSSATNAPHEQPDRLATTSNDQLRRLLSNGIQEATKKNQTARQKKAHARKKRGPDAPE